MPPSAEQPGDQERLTKVEEQVAYAQHDLDHVSREMGELYGRIAALAKRLEALEARLGKLAAGEESAAE